MPLPPYMAEVDDKCQCGPKGDGIDWTGQPPGKCAIFVYF